MLYEKGDGDCTVKFVKKIMRENPEKKIMIFWDGAAYHKGEKMRELLREINGRLAEKDWQLLVLYSLLMLPKKIQLKPFGYP